MSSLTNPPSAVENRPSRLREPLVWALVVVIAFLTLFGCGQAALERLGPPARVDTRSNIRATYLPWAIEVFAPLSTAVIADIQQDPRFPTATLNPLVPTLDPGGIWGPTLPPSPTPTRPGDTPPPGTVIAAVTPTRTVTRAPSASPTPSATPAPPTATATRVILPPTRTATATPTPPPSATQTAPPPPAATATPTLSPTPSQTGTATATGIPTATPSATTTLSPTPSATATQTLTATPTGTATATLTSTPTPPLSCPISPPEPNIGAPDGCYLSLMGGAPFDIFLSPAIEITQLVAGPDIIYFERDQGLPGSFIGSIALDQLMIQVSNDGAVFIPVFAWGDGDISNNGSMGATAPESDNLVLMQSDGRLWGAVPYKTGIAIDLDSFPVVLPIRYIRLLNVPDDSADGTEIDAIQIFRP